MTTLSDKRISVYQFLCLNTLSVLVHLGDLMGERPKHIRRRGRHGKQIQATVRSSDTLAL